MFTQLPYPLPTLAARPVSGASRPVAEAARICVVADSSLGGAWQAWGRSERRPILLDIAETPAPGPGGFKVIRLRDHFAPQHFYTPLLSLCAYHWLAARGFDLVVFAGAVGLGYYSAVAKDLGLAFHETVLAVQADSSHAFALERDHRFPQGRTDIELDFLERQTLRRVDLMCCANDAFPHWCRRAGWELPGQISIGGALPATATVARPRGSGEPLFISVCLTTYNRPILLRQAVASLLRQTYEHFEVVLVDDGSDDSAAAACLTELEPVFAARGWTILRQANGGVASARNAAVGAARGSHILFMDDDNLALAPEVERFAAAAGASDADIITCIPGTHPDSDVGPPPVAHLPTGDGEHSVCGVDWTPVGASLALAAMVNCLGDCNALYRRSMIVELGGYQGSRQSSFEDFRFLLLALVRGYRLEVLPEILFLYRRHRNSRSMRDNLFHSHVDCLSPLTELVPKELWPLLLSVHRDWYERHMNWAVKD